MAGHRQNQRRFPEYREDTWQILLKIQGTGFFAQERTLFQFHSTGTPRMLNEDETQRDRILTSSERLQLGLFVAVIGAVFAIAALMSPNPKGMETHRQLGLPPCIIRTLTGRSCPHCGLTTSFCWLVRGEWERSLAANPSGILLAASLAYPGTLSIWIIGRNRWSKRIRFDRLARNLGVIWLLSAGLLWLAGPWPKPS